MQCLTHTHTHTHSRMQTTGLMLVGSDSGCRELYRLQLLATVNDVLDPTVR